MDGEANAVSDMSADQFADFTEQMRLLVAEESFLWELPAGSRDLVGDDKWRHHGPWRQEDCSAAVHLWFDAGMVFLLRRWPDELPLGTSEARAVLAAPESWVMSGDGSANAPFALLSTDAGEALGWEDWRSMLSALRKG